MFEDLLNTSIVMAQFSNPKKNTKYFKAKAQRIIIKDKEVLQVSLFTKTQVFHENLQDNKVIPYFEKIMNEYFLQCEIFTEDFIYGFKVTNKGKILTNKRKNLTFVEVKNHNKEKQYILKEGIVVPALVDLKVMTPDGKVVKAYYDKYKQINRFLEMIDDTIEDEKNLRIIDFGCGKSYLTFVLYYYLTEIKKINVEITGLDLKEDVINNCNKISEKYGYTNLKFEKGDISLYHPIHQNDMIITLHACDTATDYALYHAIMLNTKYIFSVPCCQHEINAQLGKNQLNVINKYGLLKERFSSILTDAIRGNILEYYGYKVDIMEFIDIAHSPKNVLIRGILKENGKKKEEIKNNITKLINEYNIKQTLYELLFNSKDK